MKRSVIAWLFMISLIGGIAKAQRNDVKLYHEQYRPQFHFSPKKNWMNDPNGMVYYKGVYHLFFQYNPAGNVPANIHWGHAVSTDLIHWKEKPVALYPDDLGVVFSGSAVIDIDNTSGLGKPGHPAMIALYTSHSLKNEKAGLPNVESQSLAYSIDEGNTWRKYEGNPVIPNAGDRDFRDPKVSWYEPQKKWLMVLSAHDHVDIYSSKNLTSWVPESQFGKSMGNHDGVWECPDLFKLKNGEKEQWVLIVNINPGGPNGGSATQYFIGDFNGKEFIPTETETKWVNYGPDNYAGVTWSNTGSRKIFLGWMSNWLYGPKVPTKPWRSTMAIPVDLALKTVAGKTLLVSEPVKELKIITGKETVIKNISFKNSLNVKTKIPGFDDKFILKLQDVPAEDFSIVLFNKKSEQLKIGYDKQKNIFYINRDHAGVTAFSNDFIKLSTAPRIAAGNISLTLIVDAASAELFADNGLTNMTVTFFTTSPITGLNMYTPVELKIGVLSYANIGSIWPK